MKQTPFTSFHKALGAKIVPFAGFEMPVYYSGINEEHLAVRNGAGIFDVSHMGEFIISGEKALELIQYISSNDASKLVVGQAQYSCMPNEKGGIVDDILVYRLGEKEYLLVVNASNIQKDWDWIVRQNSFGAQMKNVSDETALLAVQGPKATEVLQPLTGTDLKLMKYYHFVSGTLAGIPGVIISATGYTGSGGFELFFKAEYAGTIWNAVMEAGRKYGLRPCGLGARDTLRLEMAYCLYGNDIDDTTSPIEAGLGWITKFTKKFIHCDNLLAQKNNGVSRKLIGFEMADRSIPRQHYKIISSGGEIIGEVTSGTMAPLLGKGIGLGYVKTGYETPGAEIAIQIRNNVSPARLVKVPFFKTGV
ncbi:MAG: glycine cleavage system aminomethyltransferase GcvT [Bacteroidetes bacterium]|nr:glycine cleavage system aminomethyltransferase GcvT [Bacteroidota bacterium]